MRARPFAALLGLVLLAAPAGAQTRAQLDSVRAELIRSRGFIRGAETQLSKTLALLDSLRGRLPVDTPRAPAPPPPDSAPPAPPASDEPVPGAAAYLADDFEAYTSTAELIRYGSRYPGRWLSAGADQIALSTEGRGRQAARFTFLAGIAQQYRLLEALGIPDDPPVLAVQFWLRTSPGYEWINATGNTHKLLNLDRPGGRILFSSGTEPQTPTLPAYGTLSELRPHFSIGTANWNQNLAFDRVRLGPGGSAVQVNDGAWHRFTMRVAKGAGTGRLELWIDGIKVLEYLGDVAGRPEAGLVNVGTEKIAAGLRFPTTVNAAPARAQWIEYDDMRVWAP